MTSTSANRSSPKVLALVTDAFGGHGGIALCMRDVLRCVASMDSEPEITLIARVGESVAAQVPANVHWAKDGLNGKWAFTRAVIAASVKREKPDLIICGHINLLPLAKLSALICNSPIVLYIHGIDAWKPPKDLLTRKLANSASRVISVSEVTRQRFLSWSKARSQDVVVVPNAIKLDRYGTGPKSPELLTRYGIEGKRVLMTLGRLSTVQRHKGVDEIIQVMPGLLEEFPDLVYLVAGDGDDIDRLRQKATDLGVGESVVFTGLVDESEKANHYRLADAFALAGRGDGFGFVLLEAMACGVPAVASVLDGSQEALLNGELGNLVNPDDSLSLLSGLTDALHQPKGVPEGLAYFAYDRFSEKLRAALEPLMVRGS